MMRRRIPPPPVLWSFIDVVESGSVTRSAERLDLTQSAASHHIAQFERFIGEPLFERGERAIRPTGRALELARRIETHLTALAVCLDEAREAGRERVVRLAVPPELCRHWLTHRLAEFARTEPAIRIAITDEVRRDVLSSGEADLQIHLGQPTEREEGFALSQDEEEVVCSPDLASRLPPREAFAAAPFLLAAVSARTHLDWECWLGEIFGLEHRWTMQPGVRHHASFDAMLEACRRGERFALVRTLLVADDIATGGLVAPIEERLRAALNYNVVWSRNPAPGGPARRLAEWLRGEAAR